MKVRTKFVASSLAITTGALICVSLYIGWVSIDSGESSLKIQEMNQLVSIRNIKKTQIEDYFSTMGKQIIAFSSDRLIIDAADTFIPAFTLFTDEIEGDTTTYKASLSQYYSNGFLSLYQKLNGGAEPDMAGLINQLDNESLALQYYYISTNRFPLGEKDQLEFTQDFSSYSQAHNSYHQPIRTFLKQFGFSDIYICDPETGDIVYSVYKELDFTTSLKDGPFADTGIGQAFEAANNAEHGEHITVTDFTPYLPSFNDPALFIASPIYDGNVKIAVLIFKVSADEINRILNYEQKWQEAGLGESGKTYLVGKDFTMRSMSRFMLEDAQGYLNLMQSLGTDDGTLKAMQNHKTSIGLLSVLTEGTKAAISGDSGFNIFRDYRGIDVLSAYSPINVFGLNWAIMSEIDAEEAFRPIIELRGNITRSAIFILVIVLTIIGFITFWSATRFIKPIRDLSSLIGIIAEGDLSTELLVAEGDEVSELYNSLHRMQNKLTEVIAGIRTGAEEVSVSTAQVSQGNANLSQRTQEQASSLEEVAASMEQMTGTVNENATNAQQANLLAITARDQAEKGRQVVGQTVSAMSEINTSSKRIADIIGVIDEIAFQTNLLALNAAVEAARAGEQGRGFAVVANEVRNLAGRSATAAKEIKGLIQDSVNKVEDGTKQADESGAMLQEVVISVKKVSDIVAEIAAASMEQSEGIGQVNKAVLQMDEMTQQNASVVEEAAAASEAMGAQAEELIDMVAYFKLGKAGEVHQGKGTPVQATATIKQAVSQQQSRSNLPKPEYAESSDDSDWKEF